MVKIAQFHLQPQPQPCVTDGRTAGRQHKTATHTSELVGN